MSVSLNGIPTKYFRREFKNSNNPTITIYHKKRIV